MVEPLAAEGPGLSDILLYEPVGLAEPDSLVAAASSMLGTTEVEDVRELGLYWEVYGPAAETPLMFTLRLEEEGEGAGHGPLHPGAPGGLGRPGGGAGAAAGAGEQ